MDHPIAVHALTLAFRDRELEDRFVESLRGSAVRRTRTTFLFGVTAWCAFGVWDFVVLPSHFGTLALIRYGIEVAASSTAMRSRPLRLAS